MLISPKNWCNRLLVSWPRVNCMRRILIVLIGLISISSGEALCQDCFPQSCKPKPCAVIVAPASSFSLPVSPARICASVVSPKRICALPVAPQRICGGVVNPGRECYMPVAPARLCAQVVSPEYSFRLPVTPERYCTKYVQEPSPRLGKCR
jgi:hypothetical protein